MPPRKKRQSGKGIRDIIRFGMENPEIVRSAMRMGSSMGGFGKRRPQKGKGFSDFTDWVKGAAGTVAGGLATAGKAVANGAVKAHDFVKDNRLISTALSLVPHPAGRPGAALAGALGYGKKRRPAARKQKGGSMATVRPQVGAGKMAMTLM